MTKKVLIVDDDPVVRLLMGECLTAKGFDVTCADGGEECFAALSIEHPDVVVLDFFMPEMTGMDVLKRMRLDPGLAQLPILMLSADSETEKFLKENDAIPNAFLQKPVGLDQIAKVISDISDD